MHKVGEMSRVTQPCTLREEAEEVVGFKTYSNTVRFTDVAFFFPPTGVVCAQCFGITYSDIARTLCLFCIGTQRVAMPFEELWGGSA